MGLLLFHLEGVLNLGLLTGYSYKSNQHGLTSDTVQGYELVLPNGAVRNVTAVNYPDLFFGLKVGSLTLVFCSAHTEAGRIQ